MKKTIIAAALLLFAVLPSLAQGLTGGIKASIVSRAGRAPISGADIELYRGGEKLAGIRSDAEGRFLFDRLDDGNYNIRVTSPGFTETEINVTVEKGLMRDLVFVTMTPSTQVSEADDSNFAEFDLDDSGYNDAPTILFAANDVFSNVAGYGFSAIRFKNRGYNSETQDVYLAGVRMNDAITGYSPYSLWSGLNEATRSKESVSGLDISELGPGGFNGATFIHANPNSVRPGLRFSLLSNSALYRLRLMMNYASGQRDDGWSYAVNASARLGGNDWIDGVFYRSFALYAGAEKRIDSERRIAFIALMTPGQRGAQNASTQEVYDLMGDNLYNSNWGYQNGKVRNSRVRSTFEPIFAIKYDKTHSDEFQTTTTLLWRTGWNGYTALDWYDASDPRPDYYRNLPSYYYMEDEDYNRTNEFKAALAAESWNPRIRDYANFQHLNWDRLYNVNYNAGGRSKYALEERHVDQNDINLVWNFRWRPSDAARLNGGFDLKLNETRNYKKMKDLLGGEYFLNIDSFAERDFATNEYKIQNDLDWYMDNREAQKIRKGDRYGYDYSASIRKARVWADGSWTSDRLTLTGAATLGVESFWRTGHVRKGLFAGLDDMGRDMYDLTTGARLTTYDEDGNVITSKGRSAVSTFLTWSAKAGAQYVIGSRQRVAANVGYFNDAPTFSQAFISARTRNSLVKGLTTIKTASADLTWQYSGGGIDARVTGYWTKIMDQTDIMSFYDDSQNSFTNFAMTGIDQRHLGVEAGVKVPLPLSGLSVSAVLSLGEYVYTSTPHMVQTVDNSSEVIRNEDVTYWKDHPTYAKDVDGNYELTLDGDYVAASRNKHYVPGTPQLATELALNYRTNSYWFFELNGQYFAHSYLDMNPLYRTDFAVGGIDGIATPAEVEYMASQEEFAPAFLLNFSAGKSWFIGDYNLGFSFEVKNMLDNRGVKTGGYEQTRLIKSAEKDRYYRFDPKYFYMCGANYMLNIYFRF